MRKKRTSSTKPQHVVDANDYGPSVRTGKGGRLSYWGGAAEIVVDTVDDTTVAGRPQTIRRARRRNVMFDLMQRGIIERRHYAASEQFLDDCSIASGGSAGDSIAGMPVASGPRQGLPERQIMAVTRVNVVRHLLGLNDGVVFWWIVFSNGGLGDYEIRYRLPRGQAKGMLVNALDALDAHYHGLADRR